ncbi:hypothetical protein [Mycoplasmopsis cynos]|nr:hypothetical protein [Mycoplasmopsis cynos]WAM04779.1 hypothetical protein ONA01_00910 [Mycoplasmopsis cynos]
MLKIDKEEAKNLANRICAMNDVISNKGAEFGLSEAYHIGHAYFKELNSSTLQEIFNNDIALIIKEYTRGRNSEEVDELIHKCLKSFGCIIWKIRLHFMEEIFPIFIKI